MLIKVIVFLTCVAAVYLFAGIIVFRFVKRRKIRPVSAVDATVLILAAAGVVCMLYGRFIEPNRLAVTHVEILSSKIPAGTRPIRIAHFSDLHSEPQARLEKRLVDAVSEERPDVIVFTGDSFNTTFALAVFRECLRSLAKIAPVFVVRGNWDVHSWGRMDLLGRSGARELDGQAVRMEIEGTPIWIAGLAFDNTAALQRTVRPIPPGEFSVILYHSPDLMPDVVEEHIDLFCAGHTHGGQVALPFYGALITLTKFGKRYEAGLYHEKDTWLYVNRGIGMAGGLAPRVRFWSRPELTVIDIRPPA